MRVTKLWNIAGIVTLAAWIFAATPLRAQTVTDTVDTGNGPHAVAVNPVTNKIYVGNLSTNTVTVIDGATNNTSTVTVGTAPTTLAVNTITNKIYVANNGSAFVTVIDGATNSTTNVAAGAGQRSVSVNPITNKIYVANASDNTVTVIDGASNTTTTLTVGMFPNTTAVNPVTNQIYVANENNNTMTVIDGATNNLTTLPVGTNPVALAVNPVTNRIYVSYLNAPNVTVIDGATNNILATVQTGDSPYVVVVNPVTNQIYTADNASDTVTVIDGASNATTTIEVDAGPRSICVNPVTNQIYVANINGNDVNVIDGATNGVVATLQVSEEGGPEGIGVNPVTNKIYVADGNNADVTVIDGATNDNAIVAGDQGTVSVAVNPATNKIYVANEGNADGAPGSVTVIDGATNVPTTVAAGATPNAIAVNPLTNQIYAAGNGAITVIDGATNNVSTITCAPCNTDATQAFAVNPVTNKIYLVVSSFQSVIVIDGATGTTSNVLSPGGAPFAVAVNPETNQIYTANFNTANATVIDGVTTNTTTVGTGMNPTAVAVNPVTNQIYVANQGDDTVTVIDGATNDTTTVELTATNLVGIAVNAVSNQIYVLDGGQEDETNGSVSVIDGATNNVTTVALEDVFSAIAVNPTTNKIYVSSADTGTVTIIDGATNTVFNSGNENAFESSGVAVNPVTNEIYLANHGSNNVTVFTEQQVQTIPLTTTITPLTGNETMNLTPTFTFAASSSFAPTAPPVDALYFQVDTWQGPWIAATPTGGGGFSGTTPTLPLGTHILFAYATDGQDAGSVSTGGNGIGQSSPIIGSIAAYVFTVLTPVPKASLNPTALNLGSETVGMPSAPLTVTLTNTGTANLVLTSVGPPAGTNASDFTIQSASTCTAQASIAPNGTCTIVVGFTPSATGARTATIAIVDNAADSPQSITLSGTGTPAPASIVATSGTPQSATIGSTFAKAFVATVTDAAGAPVSGITVFFETPDSGSGSPNGTFPGGAVGFTTTTNANGVATSAVFTANSVVGSYMVTAQVQATNLSANFSLTNNNPVPTLGSIAPTTGTLGQPVTLTLTGTNFLAGAIVNFGTNADTGGTVSNGGTTLTITIPATQLSAAGPVSVTVTNPAPTAGPSAAQTFTVNSTTGNLVITISGTVNVPRSPAAFSFPVESVGGLGGVLNSKCASPTISCLISPCPTTLLANSTVMMTVTLYTSPQMTGVVPTLREWPRQPGWRIALEGLAGLLLVCLLSARKPKVRWGFATAALTFGLVGGCGGGSSSPQNSVPPGKYAMTITETLGNTTQTVQVTLNVQ